MKLKGFDARAVANQLLDLADMRKIGLSNLHLQKVIYFAYGNYLRQFQRRLIVNRFEAWDHGPVIPELYHALKKFGDEDITGRATRFDFETRDFIEVRDEFHDSLNSFLAEMLLFYGRMDPWELVKLSHQPGGAWARTIAGAENHVNFALVISPDTIAACFCGAPGGTIQ
jgi:uncharacterized phage-associated protein